MPTRDARRAARPARRDQHGGGVKRIARGRPWAASLRRALPVLAPAFGAAVRTGLAAAFDGSDLRTAALRGAIAGFVAVWGQNVRTATIGGATGERHGSDVDEAKP